MIIEISILVISLILLFYLSHILTATLAQFSNKLKVSKFIVGSIILAIGTSLPELVNAITSSIIKIGELSIGTIIGSNIANVGIALALTAIIRPIKNIYKREIRETIIVLIATVAFILFTLNGVLSRLEGAIMFSSYFMYQFALNRRSIKPKIKINLKNIEVDVLLIPLTLIGIIICGYLVVTSSIAVTNSLGLSLTFFGLTILALGTSMPEIAASLVSSMKRQSKLVIGNIVGSNIVNLLLIGGLTAIINPVNLEINSAFIFSIFSLFLITVLLEYVTITGKEITRKEGIAMLISYIVYMYSLNLIS